MIINIFKANNRIEELANDNKNLANKLQEANTQIENLHKMSEDFATTKANIEKEFATKEEEYKKTIEELSKMVEAEKDSAEQKAANILSSVGVPEAELPKPSATDNTPEGLWGQWETLKAKDTKAATEFYNKHRDTFRKMVGFNGK